MQSVVIVKHETERRRKAVTTLHCGGTCCCCCCCLHTVGSIIGAAMAPGMGGGRKAGVPLVDYWDEEDERPDVSASNGHDGGAITSSAPPAFKPTGGAAHTSLTAGERNIALPALPSAVSAYWWTLCLLIVLAFVYGGMVGGGGSFVITLVVVLLALPALQLASSLVTLVVLAVWPRRDKSHQFKLLGKITAGVVIGTILGILPMICLLAVFRWR